jgi:hypothetical protein
MTGSNRNDPRYPAGVGEIVRRSVPPSANVEHMHAPVPAANAEAAGPAEAVKACSAMDAIAEGLAAGAIDGPGARARLVERAVARQLPARVDPALLECIRAEVDRLLTADPTLARLLRRA